MELREFLTISMGGAVTSSRAKGGEDVETSRHKDFIVNGIFGYGN